MLSVLCKVYSVPLTGYDVCVGLTMACVQLAGQRKREDSSEGSSAAGGLSTLSGLRPSYW